MINDRQRRQIAAEAARLLVTGAESELDQARLRAARQIFQGPVQSENLPTSDEVRQHLEALAAGGHDAVEPLRSAEPGNFDRFHFYSLLLTPLEEVAQDPVRHPEGDVLYHSLQVFELARQRLPYDEDFLLAALLHDVGKAIDKQDHVAAGLATLKGFISERTEWLIQHHSDANALHRGTLGQRARKRLAANESFDELMLLAECDRGGRQRGMQVPDVEDALRYIRELDEAHGE